MFELQRFELREASYKGLLGNFHGPKKLGLIKEKFELQEVELWRVNCIQNLIKQIWKFKKHPSKRGINLNSALIFFTGKIKRKIKICQSANLEKKIHSHNISKETPLRVRLNMRIRHQIEI